NARKEKPIWYKNWYKEGQKKVVVQVPTMQELLELIEQAEWEDLPFSLVKDAGLTELPPGSTTVGAIGPAPYEKVDKITADLKLL
ncbi:MAG: aminoacyl-tRNA hydrolase, partial [Asgard group archaeon]|nr:aminoacyl-tRNA hydrolase [Asgard group archaeon]